MAHILIDCERMKYINTGLYTYCHELGSALLKKAVNDQLCFYLPRKLGKHFGPDESYLWQRSLHKFYLPHRQQFDVWHSTYQTSLYRTLNSRTRKLLTVHDLNFLHESKSKASRKKYLSLLQRNIHKADHIVTISEFVKKEVLQYTDTGGKPLDVIYNGSRVEEFSGFDDPVYRPGRPFLFALGVVLPKKNFHVLPCLLKNNDLELVIAGQVNEEYKSKILHEAAKHGVTGRVKILGGIPASQKYWYLKNCYAFMFPSLAEGFGLPAVEAMHFGKPVFLSTTTSLPEIGGDAAYYFDSFEPERMRQVFETGMQDYLKNHRAPAITDRARLFNWDHTADAYLSIYRQLAAR
ncbi:glycosyltransferase family 1 protein [Chitinophaga lutea]|uniref:Glycosyltransferase family 1 protein n=1 Tax=Chitinophaga lutea TaxID=2488634 RepID=A0A3N4Q726_9BACT|nr:glycosyltransferase family 1 protein [Chitinophaga lutea]RPE13351.1 glycosyltransferase family 1 protein [Chitinophaga lutea]